MAKGKRSAKSGELPEEFFHAIAYLLPGLNQVAQECNISIGEWIIMWHLQQAGVLNDKGERTMLRQVLTDLLAKRGFGDANIVRLLNSLEDKDLIRRVSLTQHEREDLFSGSGIGNRQAVLLQTSGEQKIQEFKQRLAVHFSNWRLEQSVMIQKALDSASGVGKQFADWFFKGSVAPKT
jgi:DNA-binding MarR family transcriptional regulator